MCMFVTFYNGLFFVKILFSFSFLFFIFLKYNLRNNFHQNILFCIYKYIIDCNIVIMNDKNVIDYRTYYERKKNAIEIFMRIA